MGEIIIDLRDLSIDTLNGTSITPDSSRRYLLNAWQFIAASQFRKSLSTTRSILIMVPDFLQYARLANTGRPAEILRLSHSLPALAQSALRSIPTGIAQLKGLATGNFWSAAQALTSYDLGLLPIGFEGEVILHQNLADFACFFEKQNFFHFYQRRVPSRIQAGISTQQPAKLLSACARWKFQPARVIQLAATEINTPSQLIKEAFPHTIWTHDITLWPPDRQATALDSAENKNHSILVAGETGLNLIQ